MEVSLNRVNPSGDICCYRGYKGVQGDVEGYKRILGDTKNYMGYKGILGCSRVKVGLYEGQMRTMQRTI